MYLEVIAKDLEDVKDINNTSANRIELCKDLLVGGLTPDFDLIKQATELSKLPINVIVRRTHENFVYSKQEKKQILEDISFIKQTKANGIVFGALTKKNKIDIKFLKKVIKAKGNKEITFHKAFDEVNNFVKSYKILNKLNVTSVLTSGGLDLANGIDILNKLKKLDLKTIILVGGGVTKDNFSSIKKISGFVHIGRLARKNNSWEQPINKETINNLIKK
ncbi:copper homeostasis protein [Spiroplasma litorale]|uniref:Copper homeostasis protein cutC homolog n=1 Tax=Spiroplasma litorale TaxID=216942 RepID=A0A0K1W0N7_9MOLU|nr:copper homeostasis protein CutC [Spiroplasma litorale]AKX33875.1 copper homeostasis protein [Spiroplasma litorale]